MISTKCLKEELRPSSFIKKFQYEQKFRKEYENYFYADGLTVFVGPQGSGKTLSAVNYVYKLMNRYPKAILVTNIALTDYSFDNERVFEFVNADDLKKYNNGFYGVIFLIDEIHLYFNSLDSKNINVDVMAQISQQRKQRKHIVATSQVFGRMAKQLREQFNTIIYCKCYFDIIQKNQLLDRDSIEGEESTSTNIKGKVKKNFFWLRSPYMFERYDTYTVINRINVSSEKGGDIYDRH